MNFFNFKKGFTLMEVIVSIAIVLTGLIGSIGLIFFSVSGISYNENRLMASNLAQEGIEIVRNIRDSNWLSYKRGADEWRDGLAEGQWRVEYSNTNLLSYEDQYLKRDSNGFYQYQIGDNTVFKRTITIEHIESNQIRVISKVDWQTKGRDQSFSLEARLYNWLEE
ncbi:MAG: prepilin-type N-terminal cleavage/methylation domain-containing protein [Candidatus Portnoybacteria bacterium]|nr:prepilin-type N-terminal cleavage/methylation domain-containing protein [Candidatus Portnoybacteria bacterium]